MNSELSRGRGSKFPTQGSNRILRGRLDPAETQVCVLRFTFFFFFFPAPFLILGDKNTVHTLLNTVHTLLNTVHTLFDTVHGLKNIKKWVPQYYSHI